jgi:hypothetical protein
MARGSLAKTNIGNAILQVFPGAFIDADKKTIRIPTTCEGEPIEVKVSLVAAKDLVGGNTVSVATSEQAQAQNRAMTDEEVNEIKELIKRLNL